MFLFPVVFRFQGTGTKLFSWSEHSLPYKGQTKLALDVILWKKLKL